MHGALEADLVAAVVEEHLGLLDDVLLAAIGLLQTVLGRMALAVLLQSAQGLFDEVAVAIYLVPAS